MGTSILAHSSYGLCLTSGPPFFKDYGDLEKLQKINNAFGFTPNGRYLLVYGDQELLLCDMCNMDKKYVFHDCYPSELFFSPRSTYFGFWGSYGEPTSQTNPKTENVHVFEIQDMNDAKLSATFSYQFKRNWQLKWSSDEHISARIVNNDDVVFYENGDFKTIVNRIKGKVSGFSIAPGDAPYHIITYRASARGQPTAFKLYKYPDLYDVQVVVSKSLFQADKVEFHWNKKGNCALLMAIAEVDKTGGSYYGKQTLYFVTTSGTANMVNFDKEGPVHSVAWSPNGEEFCAIYGFLPSSAALYNSKCEPLFEFPPSPKNEVYYNPFGNILILAGFGNIRGNIEVWDVEKKQLVSNFAAPDTTLLQWAPDGIHFLTASTAPRLRVDNKYKIWHHAGTLLYEKKYETGKELYSVHWRMLPEGYFRKPEVEYKHTGGIQNSEPQASTQAYRPPCARDRASAAPPEKVLSKATIKLKKKREAKKVKKLVIEAEKKYECKTEENMVRFAGPDKFKDLIPPRDAEKDKKVKQIRKKLASIRQLKDQQAAGKTLEINQIAKINTEWDLLSELENLMLH